MFQMIFLCVCRYLNMWGKYSKYIFIKIVKCQFWSLSPQFVTELCGRHLDPIQLCLWLQLADHLLPGFRVLMQLNKELALAQGRSLAFKWKMRKPCEIFVEREQLVACCPMRCHGNLSPKVYLLFWETGISQGVL